LKNEPDKAIADYTRCLALNKNHINALTNRGQAFVQKGQFERGLQDFARPIEINQKAPRQ